MKQRGALFTTENRVAIREDRKTMTRRIPASFKEINEHPDEWEFEKMTCMNSIAIFCSKKDGHHVFVKIHWVVGDELYIKEPHYLYGWWNKNGLTKTGKQKWKFYYDKPFGVHFPDNIRSNVKVCSTKRQNGRHLHSPLFMPRWAARDWLRVTNVKVQRLQSIDEIDAQWEGTPNYNPYPSGVSVDDYHRLWDSINSKKHPWERNEWVVAYTFKRIK